MSWFRNQQPLRKEGVGCPFPLPYSSGGSEKAFLISPADDSRLETKRMHSPHSFALAKPVESLFSRVRLLSVRFPHGVLDRLTIPL
jgi:hypothetical protein